MENKPRSHREHSTIEHKPKPYEHKPVEKQINTKLVIMAVALGVLLLVSGVQAVKLIGLKDKLTSEMTTLSAQSKTKVSAGGGGSNANTLKSSLNNLPTMVGGC